MPFKNNYVVNWKDKNTPIEISPELLDQHLFGGGWKPSTLRDDMVQFRLERAAQLVEAVLMEFDYNPKDALKLYHVVRNYVAWARAYIGEEAKDLLNELSQRLPRKVPTDIQGLARYFDTLMHIYEDAISRVARGQYVTPEIPIDVRIIGRDMTEILNELGVGTLSKEELESAIKDKTDQLSKKHRKHSENKRSTSGIDSHEESGLGERNVVNTVKQVNSVKDVNSVNSATVNGVKWLFNSVNAEDFNAVKHKANSEQNLAGGGDVEERSEG